ncbi:diguanylate cyclase (GGDEF)-like protein [Aeromonas sp. BIGb0405]|uniref:GGDEF domain-containing protein n=1 Tax=Aeromonas sp. BIGb0405 TaxID=2940592 RepID=UPI002167D92C|nr:GGDEF domain-containing protein [Aeromonas sp. BIGb0405]MCS3454536.1 diguanylate cyclase (GGDEF)-like protein [Aeromonas sp. BIGb0405]
MTIHTPTLLIISLAINLMAALLMLFIHRLKPGRGNFLLWSLSAFLFSFSILLLCLGSMTGYVALGLFWGGFTSLICVLLLLAGFYALYDKPLDTRSVRGFVALFLLSYLVLASQFDVRLVLALIESVIYLWCACLIFSLSQTQKRVLHTVSFIYLIHFVILLSQGIALLAQAFGPDQHAKQWLLDTIFFMHMVLTIGSVLLLPLVAYVQTEEELLALSERDPLTGVLNRRGLFKLGERHCASQPDGVLCVAVLDIDHFKQVNDKFGHGCGDQVIRFVAQTLMAEMRKDDLVGRIGGEEFAIIMRGVNGRDAFSICDRIRSQIALGASQGRCLPCDAVTVSLGGVCAHGEVDLAQLLDRADEAMYRVKLAGRNGVFFQPETEPLRLVESGEG